MRSTAAPGSIELDPRLERRADEVLIEKQRASAFWGTPLGAYLTGRKIDTLIITGCSTSGCIRATAESAHNENYHTIVVREAVGDRHPLAHECNLTDIDLRYGDVVAADDVIAYLRTRENQPDPKGAVCHDHHAASVRWILGFGSGGHRRRPSAGGQRLRARRPAHYPCDLGRRYQRPRPDAGVGVVGGADRDGGAAEPGGLSAGHRLAGFPAFAGREVDGIAGWQALRVFAAQGREVA